MNHHQHKLHVKTIIGNGLYPLIEIEDQDFSGTYSPDHADRIMRRLHHHDPLVHAIEHALQEIHKAVASVA